MANPPVATCRIRPVPALWRAPHRPPPAFAGSWASGTRRGCLYFSGPVPVGEGPAVRRIPIDSLFTFKWIPQGYLTSRNHGTRPSGAILFKKSPFCPLESTSTPLRDPAKTLSWPFSDICQDFDVQTFQICSETLNTHI